MTSSNEVRSLPKHSCAEVEGAAERTRNRPVYVPRAEIRETAAGICVCVDMPGVAEKDVDITLEKNVLSITGSIEPELPEGLNLTYAEYAVGDYQRSFTLPNEVDRDGITASVKNGVLKLFLPRSGESKSKKITVNAG